MKHTDDRRIIMTLDAGGTKFSFSAVRNGLEIVPPFVIPSFGDDLENSLKQIKSGFHYVRKQLETAPAAISFGFPGPADFENGVIGDLFNLPGFRGGVALAAMLREEFQVPVFINNDVDLFAYGESIAGLLPCVNGKLKEAGSRKRFHTLIGVTLGTGFGGGIVHNGVLFRGDNSSAAEVWKMSNRIEPGLNAEELISIRALRRTYAELTGIPEENVPSPEELYEIGLSKRRGDTEAAVETFRRLGRALGDVLCNIISVADGLVVIGGGISRAKSLIVPAMLEEMRSTFISPSGKIIPRLTQKVFYLENKHDLSQFVQDHGRPIKIPYSDKEVIYDPVERTGIGFSRLGTSRAISIGAYFYALKKINRA